MTVSSNSHMERKHKWAFLTQAKNVYLHYCKVWYYAFSIQKFTSIPVLVIIPSHQNSTPRAITKKQNKQTKQNFSYSLYEICLLSSPWVSCSQLVTVHFLLPFLQFLTVKSLPVNCSFISHLTTFKMRIINLEIKKRSGADLEISLC